MQVVGDRWTAKCSQSKCVKVSDSEDWVRTENPNESYRCLMPAEFFDAVETCALSLERRDRAESSAPFDKPSEEPAALAISLLRVNDRHWPC